MRLPSMTTPEPLISLGACLVHGLKGSGWRMVEKTLTTEFSILGAASAGWSRAVAPQAADARAPAINTKPRKEGRLDRVMRGFCAPICRRLKTRAERCPAGRNAGRNLN